MMLAIPEFDLLETLIAVAESKNFKEAGEKLNLSQPGVTQKLQKLGAKVPYPLFQLEGKRKVLTRYAQEIYKLAKTQQNDFHEKYESLHRQYASAEFLTIRVGGRGEMMESLSDSFLFPGKTEFHPMSSKDAVQKLLKQEIDIAITPNLPDTLHFNANKLISSGAKIAIHKSLLKDKKGTLSSRYLDPDFLQNVPCVTYLPDGHLLSELFKHVGIQLKNANVRAGVEDWRMLMRMIEKKCGYGVVPDYIRSLTSEIVEFSIPEKILPRFQFYALFAKDLRKIKGFSAVRAIHK